MAGAACKVIINNQTRALTAGLEQVLMSPLVRGVMISIEKADELIQRMADMDTAYYTGQDRATGDYAGGGLADILVELEKEGVITGEVWEILRHPDTPTRVKAKGHR